MGLRDAIIDVGTNSVKLLVAERTPPGIELLLERACQTRLGSGFYPALRLQPAAIQATAEAVVTFAALARSHGAGTVRVVATSAAREAVNAPELAAAVKRASGLELVIVSGEQEAEWVFAGVASEPELARRRLLIIDAGGGSTEFVMGDAGVIQFRWSYPLGTVRLLEYLAPGDPPSAADWRTCREHLVEVLRQKVVPVIGPALARHRGLPVQAVGASGSATLLAKISRRVADYDRDRLEGTRLTRQQLRDLRHQLWSLPLAERRNVAGLPADRADVILMGVALYETALEELQLPSLLITTRGFRVGALLDIGRARRV